VYCDTWQAGAPLGQSIAVRLLHNLTEYHPALRAGVDGVTVGDGRYGVLVRLPESYRCVEDGTSSNVSLGPGSCEKAYDVLEVLKAHGIPVTERRER